MSDGGLVLVSGKDGVLVGLTPREAVQALDVALAHERVVVHVHGGLVNEHAGRRIADRLSADYLKAGAFPIFLVWQSGLFDILKHNMLEILREEIFERLLRLVLGWTVGKVRQTSSGGRSVVPQLPAQFELEHELSLRRMDEGPDGGREPFAEEARISPGGLHLSDAEERRFLLQVRGDHALRRPVIGPGTDVELTRAPDAQGAISGGSVPTVLDREVLDELALESGGRGVISTAVMAKKALDVLRAVIKRYRDGTDSGLYPTVVEELLRAFYLAHAGGAVWAAMKRETTDTFDSRAPDRAGGLLLARLAAPPRRLSRVTLVGHSTGAVFVNNLLTAAARGGAGHLSAERTVQAVYLAPACTTEHFALSLDVAESLVARTSVFTMSDVVERSDRLAGSAYPRSLLYLVSNVLERDRDRSAVVPVLGLARYLDPALPVSLLESELGRAGRLDRVRTYLAAPRRLVLSPTEASAGPGTRATATRHGDFDEDPSVRDSLTHLVRDF